MEGRGVITAIEMGKNGNRVIGNRTQFKKDLHIGDSIIIQGVITLIQL
jgi:hypothetical protein